MAAIITLTTLSTTTITELIDTTNLPVVFTHPVVGFDLSEYWSLFELQEATSLQLAITNGDVIVYRDGIQIQSLNQLQVLPQTIIEHISTSTSVSAGSDVVVFTGGTRQTIMLPSPTTLHGKTITIKNISTNDVDITTSSGNVDGYTNITFVGDSGSSLSVTSDGNNWNSMMAFSGYTKKTAVTALFPKTSFPKPFITSSSPPSIPPNVTTNITIVGGIFTNDTVVTVGGSTVNSITATSSNELIVNITTGAVEAFFDITVSNTGGLVTSVNAVRIFSTPWVDLRTGGDVFTSGNGAGNDIRFSASMTLNRDATGMSFTGLAPWSTWVKFESLAWVRGTNKTLQWIYSQPSNNMMIGISSTATNETSTAQYAQFENSVYYNTATSLWGLYGNTGTVGTAGSISQSSTIGAGTYKSIFTSDGGTGGIVTTYLLPSAAKADWDDISTVISTITVAGGLAPNEPNIMPGIIPQNGGTQRFIAVYVS